MKEKSVTKIKSDSKLNYPTETELGKTMVSHFRKLGYQVWQEVRVKHYSSTVNDIVMVSPNNDITILELKLLFNYRVMEQIYDSKRYNSHNNSIDFFAIGVCGRGTVLQKEICEYLGLGIYFGDYDYQVKETLAPKRVEVDIKKKQHLLETLQTIPQNYSQAGTNAGGYYSPYKRTIDAVKEYLKKHGKVSQYDLLYADEIKKVSHYANNYSLIASLKKFETDWCGIENQQVFLKDT